MNEFIEVRFRKNAQRLRVKRQVPGGIEFDERDPLERTVGFQFHGRSEVTRQRMRNIARIQGWAPGEFRLNVSVQDGSIVLRGVNPHGLPAGAYDVRVEVEEAKTTQDDRKADVDQDGHDVLTVDVTMDDRSVDVDLEDRDARIGNVLDRSTVDGAAAVAWLESAQPRPTRQACLLNLLASLRIRPSLSAPLIDLVHDVYEVRNDRVYAKVDRQFLATLQALALDPAKPFYEEGSPQAAIHQRLLTELPEPPDVKARFGGLRSFRGEGRPSMQTIIAVAPADLPHTYAEFDLDLGNPLQDLVGFVVHLGELLDGKPTNHLDLRQDLARTKAKEFLHYTVTAARDASTLRPSSARRASR